VFLHIERDPDTRSIRLTGEIDLSTAQDLEDCLECEPPGQDVTIDFSGVSFMDSTGINVLIRAAKRLKQGHTLRVFRPQGGVQRVLAVCGIDALPGFEIVDQPA
jgi:anti-anti-sigma factor